MAGASKIRFVGNPGSPNGAKIQARIPEPLPYQIKLDGTTDVSRVNGNSGQWISMNFHTSLAVTLIYLDASGQEIERFTYDANGEIALNPPVCFVEFIFGSVSASIDSGNGNIFIFWGITNPQGVVSYDVQRSGTNSGTFITIGNVPDDGNLEYNYMDGSPLSGSNFYRIVPRCSDTSTGAPSIVTQAV